MRAAISLFVTGLLLSSLSVNSQTVTNSVSNLLQSNSDSDLLISAKSKPGKTPYRGSGRGPVRDRLSYLYLSSKAPTPARNRRNKGDSRRDFMENTSNNHVVA